jgi:hypothetical protein
VSMELKNGSSWEEKVIEDSGSRGLILTPVIQQSEGGQQNEQLESRYGVDAYQLILLNQLCCAVSVLQSVTMAVLSSGEAELFLLTLCTVDNWLSTCSKIGL